MMRYFVDEFGNAGSRTHEFGARAKQAVENARRQVAKLSHATPDEVIFTSGATESNNLALLGLATHGEASQRTHIVSTAIEHKAILEPLAHLAQRGFEVTLVKPTAGGWVDPEAIRKAIRRDTLLVSVMHVNNETGVIQPVDEIADALGDHSVFLHVDAAQSFGKAVPGLANRRIDLISTSAHKIFGPKGIGALVTRRRGFDAVPLRPVFFGGGQERGLRPGTLPVPLVVGFGIACELASRNQTERALLCQRFKNEAVEALDSLGPRINGDPERTVAHTLNLSFEGIDSEAVILAVKQLVALSNGSACTASTYAPSHVLEAMGLPRTRIQGSLRLSWCHMTPTPDWKTIRDAIARLR
jgi:cysteine desulfurase